MNAAPACPTALIRWLPLTLICLSACLGRAFPLQPQSSFKGELEAEQLVTFQFREHEFSLHQSLEINGTLTRLIAFTPMGPRAFLLEQDTSGLRFENGLPHRFKIRPEYLLADLQKLYWPPGPLEGPGNWTIQERPEGRLVMQGERLDSRISRLPGGAKGDFLLENLRFGYRLEIRTLGDNL